MMLKEHDRWVARGKEGEGRVVMTDEPLMHLRAHSLRGARFERCDFANSQIHSAEDAEFVECTFDDSNFSSSDFDRVRMDECRMRGAWCALARFDGAVINGGDWLGAYLERSSWKGAVVTGVSFRACTFIDGMFDGATFIDCEFRHANLNRKGLTLNMARCPDTRFVHCNFQGANIDGLRFNNTTFERCGFNDMIGKPDLEGPCTLIETDISSRFNGLHYHTDRSPIVSQEEVLHAWREWDAIRINGWSSSTWSPDKHYPERRQK